MVTPQPQAIRGVFIASSSDETWGRAYTKVIVVGNTGYILFISTGRARYYPNRYLREFAW